MSAGAPNLNAPTIGRFEGRLFNPTQDPADKGMPTANAKAHHTGQPRAKSITRRLRKPEWDSTQQDIEKATPEDIQKRAARHTSKFLDEVKRDFEKKSLSKAIKRASTKPAPSAVTREVLRNAEQIHDTLRDADRSMSRMKDIFGPVRSVEPVMTPTPGVHLEAEYEFKPTHEESLSHSLMAGSAINELSEQADHTLQEAAAAMRSFDLLTPQDDRLSQPQGGVAQQLFRASGGDREQHEMRRLPAERDVTQASTSSTVYNRKLPFTTHDLSATQTLSSQRLTQQPLAQLLRKVQLGVADVSRTVPTQEDANPSYTQVLLESMLVLVAEVKRLQTEADEHRSEKTKIALLTEDVAQMRQEVTSFRDHVFQQFDLLRTDIWTELETISKLFNATASPPETETHFDAFVARGPNFKSLITETRVSHPLTAGDLEEAEQRVNQAAAEELQSPRPSSLDEPRHFAPLPAVLNSEERAQLPQGRVLNEARDVHVNVGRPSSSTEQQDENERPASRSEVIVENFPITKKKRNVNLSPAFLANTKSTPKKTPTGPVLRSPSPRKKTAVIPADNPCENLISQIQQLNREHEAAKQRLQAVLARDHKN